MTAVFLMTTTYSYFIAINLFQLSKLGALLFLALVSMLVIIVQDLLAAKVNVFK